MDVSSLPQGLYLVRIENGVVDKPTFVNTTVGKFVKLASRYHYIRLNVV
jgi:hypothetical protein